MVKGRLPAVAVAALGLVLAAACGGGERGPEPASNDAAYREFRDAARDAYARGDLHDALRRVARALAARPAERDSYDLASRCHVDSGDDAGAIRFFEATTRIAPGEPWPWHYLGFHRFRAGQWDEALEAFDRAAALRPEVGEFPFRRGLVLQAMGDFDGALAALRRARTLDSGSEVVCARLVRLLRITGDYEGAAAEATAALATFPRSAELHAALGQIRMREGRADEAEAELARAIEIDPRSEEAHRALARLLAAAGRDGEAEAQREVADRLAEAEAVRAALGPRAAGDLRDAAAMLTLAELELGEARPDVARRWLDRAAVAGADPDRVATLRAASAFAAGDVAAGDAALAVVSEPDSPRVVLARAARFVATGDGAAARRLLERVARTAPEERLVLLRLSDLCRAAGDDAAAAAAAARAAAAPPPVEGLASPPMSTAEP